MSAMNHIRAGLSARLRPQRRSQRMSSGCQRYSSVTDIGCRAISNCQRHASTIQLPIRGATDYQRYSTNSKVYPKSVSSCENNEFSMKLPIQGATSCHKHVYIFKVNPRSTHSRQGYSPGSNESRFSSWMLQPNKSTTTSTVEACRHTRSLHMPIGGASSCQKHFSSFQLPIRGLTSYPQTHSPRSTVSWFSSWMLQPNKSTTSGLHMPTGGASSCQKHISSFQLPIRGLTSHPKTPFSRSNVSWFSSWMLHPNKSTTTKACGRGYHSERHLRGVSGANVRPFSEIPGPVPWPIVGNTVQLMQHKDYDITRFHKVWESLFKEYGPIVKLNLTSMPTMVATINPDDIETFFKSTMQSPTRQMFLSLKSVRDNAPNNYFKKRTGLISENGKEWLRLRSRVEGPLLEPRNVNSYLPQVDKTTKTYMERIDILQAKTGRVPTNFTKDINLWALECLGHIAFDRELGCLKPGLRPDSLPMRMIRHLSDLFVAMNDMEVGPKTWMLYKTESYHKMESAHNAFLHIADRITEESFRPVVSSPHPASPPSIMTSLLSTPGLARSDVITLIMDMMFAGIDTTSHSLIFMLYHLAKNTEAQKKLQAEVDDVVGDAEDLLPQHMEDMTYLSCVIKESLRIHPVAVGTARDLQKDIVMSGYRVQAGTLAMGVNLLICREEKYFPRARSFLPERWGAGSPYGAIHPFASLPFSYGTRSCVGRRIAQQQINTFLIRVMQKYTVTFESSQKMRTRTLPFIKPIIPLPFKFHPRKK